MNEELDFNIIDEELQEVKLKIPMRLQYFATDAKQEVHSAATVLLMIGNDTVGRCQSVDGRRSFGTEGVYEIGDIMPKEHVHHRYEGTVTIDRFFMKRKTLKDLGFAALGEEILRLDLLDIVVVSKADKSILRAYRGCTCTEYSENIRVGAIAGENATFQYLKASDSRN